MEQLKAFLEKVNQDNELMEKLEALCNNSEEMCSDAIVVLAAKYGFNITADEIEDINLLAQHGEISEEQLEAVTGGASVNRYCPEWCKGLTKARMACWFPIVWCDHYRETHYTESAHYIETTYSCAMGAFPDYKYGRQVPVK